MFEPDHLRFTYVNQGAVNQVGWSRDELLSMSALEIKPDFDEASYRELIAPLLDGYKARRSRSPPSTSIATGPACPSRCSCRRCDCPATTSR